MHFVKYRWTPTCNRRAGVVGESIPVTHVCVVIYHAVLIPRCPPGGRVLLCASFTKYSSAVNIWSRVSLLIWPLHHFSDLPLYYVVLLECLADMFFLGMPTNVPRHIVSNGICDGFGVHICPLWSSYFVFCLPGNTSIKPQVTCLIHLNGPSPVIAMSNVSATWLC